MKPRSLVNVSDEFEEVKKATIDSVQELFPVIGKNKALHLDKVWIDDNQDYNDIKGQLQAKLEEKTWGVPLMGRLSLRDNHGHVIDSKEVRLADLPKPTPRLGYIVGGQEYQLDKQWRLRPGVYARVKDNGELAAHINTAGGDRMFVEYDPVKRRFMMTHGNSTMPLFPLLKAMGVDDKDLHKNWGTEIFDANSSENYEKAVKKYYKVETGKEPKNLIEATRYVRDSLKSKQLDPTVTEDTLGKPVSRFDQDAILLTTKKLLDIARGDKESDDRDSLPYRHLHSTEDFVGEKLKVYGKSIRRRIGNVVDREQDLTRLIYPGMLNRAIDSTFTDSILSRIPSQDNPIEFLEGHTKTTPMGQGGISDIRMIGEEAKGVNPTQLGFMDPNDTPEGERVGITGHLTLGAHKKGNDVYAQVYNVKTGKMEYISPATFVKSVVALPDSVRWEGAEGKKKPVPTGKKIRVSGPSNEILSVPFNEVDYVVPSAMSLVSPASSIIPFLQNNDAARIGMANRHLTQAVPLKYREEPLVQSRSSERDVSAIQLPGSISSHKAEVAGTVSRVDRGVITVTTPTGKKMEHQIYDYFPLNDKKTGIHAEAVVKVGDKVKEGDVLADTNFTKGGKLALGTNLRVGYISIPGKVFEDGVVISETAAKKLTSTHLHRHTVEQDENSRIGKSAFAAYYPMRYNRDQLAKLDDSGIIREGQIINPGDPVSVQLQKQAFTTEARAMAKMKKSLVRPYADASFGWDHEVPGKVVRVHKLPDGRTKVFVHTEEPIQVADKISGTYGNKGTVVEIWPDKEMPKDAQGKPIEVALGSMGVAGRMNLGQIYELAAGKIAEKTGKPYLTANFEPDTDYGEKVRKQMADLGIPEKETLFDPKTGKRLGDVFVGPAYIIKQRHQVEKKISARSGGPGFAYDIDRQPRRSGQTGAQAIGGLGNLALLAHGSRNILREAVTYKSDLSQQDELWRSIQLGLPLPPPKSTFAQKKFENYLLTLGVKLKKDGTRVQMIPVRDSDILKISNGEIEKPNLLLKANDLAPEVGGLFDQKVTGGFDGDKVSHIKLPEPIPNPFFERGVTSLLGVTKTDILDILAGKKGIRAGEVISAKEEGVQTGSAAIKQALKNIDVDKEIKNIRLRLPSLSGQVLDKANKKLRYLEALRDNKISPDEAYMTQVIPVMPPTMRPIVPLPSGDLATDPLNETYKALGITVHSFKNLDPRLPERSRGRLRKELYTSLASLQGIGAGYKRVQGGETQGIMDIFTLPTAKHAWIQERLFKQRQDLSGRSVIVPDPDLQLDEIGIPHRIASEIYKPFVVRELTRTGYSALKAGQMIKANDSMAEAALRKVMAERPVLAKRDPVLHKYGIQAFKPRLDKGFAIKIHPLVTGSLNADFDGDQIIGSVILAVNRAIFNSLTRKSRHATVEVGAEWYHKEWWNQRRLGGDEVARFREMVPLLGDDDLYLVDLADFPHGNRLSEDGKRVDFHEALPGFRVFVLDSSTFRPTIAPVSHWSLHRDRKVELVNLRSGRQILTDDDPRGVLGLDSSLNIVRRCPKESFGLFVPVIHDFLIEESIFSINIPKRDSRMREKVLLDFSAGRLLGRLVGDGWVSRNMGHLRGQVCLSAEDDGVLQEFRKDLLSFFIESPTITTTERIGGDFGPGVVSRMHVVSSMTFSRLIDPLIGHTAKDKHLPPFYLQSPKEFRLGLLSGLLDTDGSISVSRGKKNPQWMCSISTSSLRLANEIRLLGMSLGIRISITASKTPEGRSFWMLTVSTVDLHKVSGLALSHSEKNKRLNAFLQGPSPQEKFTYGDIIPTPADIARIVRKGLCGKEYSLYAVFSQAQKRGYVSRYSAEEALSKFPDLRKDPLLVRWVSLVDCASIRWDPVVSIEKTDIIETGYDLTVPGYEMFMAVDGVVLSNTMSLYTPITPGAIEDAKKMMPSNNLLHPATGQPVFTPSKEMSLGLYRATRIGDSKKVSEFQTVEEVLEANRAGKIGWETIKLKGKPTTVGRVRLYSSLPSNYRNEDLLFDPEKIWDSKRTNSILKQIAEEKPQEYAKTVQSLMNLGAKNVYEDAFSLGPSDFIADKETREDVFSKARVSEEKIRSSGLTKKEKNEKIIGIWMDASDELSKKHWAKDPAKTSLIAQMAVSGVKPGKEQYKQLVLSPVMLTAMKGRLIQAPQQKSYSEGVDTADFFVHGMAGRATMVQKTQEVRDPGYLTKQMVNTVADVVVSSKDCGTTDGISLSTDHPDVQGRYLAKAVSVGGTRIPAKTMLTGKIVDMLRKEGVQSVVVRSPSKCHLPQGICSSCYGVSGTGSLPEIGENLGVIAGQALGERSTQLFMRQFHLGGVAQRGGGSGAVSQFNRVTQLLRIPELIPNSATLAEDQGEVKRIVPDPAGHRLFLKTDSGKEVEHHIPGILGLRKDIRVGSRVSAGTPLSNGLVNLHDLLRTSGVESVQNQIVNELDDIYRKEGLKRRNMEVLARGVTNLGMVEDPGDNPSLRRGDMTPLSVVSSWNDKKLGKSVKVKPVLRGMGYAPLELTENWLAKLHHERLKDTLVDAALESHKADVSGLNPFSALAGSPATFGLGVSGEPGAY